MTDLAALTSSTKYHFVVGLPRSGSTMLAALLNQNPALFASGPSPAYALFNTAFKGMSDESELPAMINDTQRAAVLKAIVEAVHASQKGGAGVVFDSNRRWIQRMDQLAVLFPLCRIIACVRDPAKVMNSLEKSRRQAPFLQNRMFHPDDTLAQSVDRAMARDGILGAALNLVEQALTGPHAERMILVDYDLLLEHPAKVMSALYSFLRIPHFAHDFDSFSFEMPGFDTYLNAPGLHDIKGPLRPRHSEMLLPPTVAKQLSARATWHDIQSEAVKLLKPRAQNQKASD
jgi:sulfotransferase